MMKEPLRVMVSNPHLRGERAPVYDCHLDGELLCQSHQPLFDCARVLLERGYDPGTLLTTRHAGKDFDSFMAESIEKLAKLTVEDGRDGRPRFRRWRPNKVWADGSKSRNSASPGTGDRGSISRILGRDAAA